MRFANALVLTFSSIVAVASANDIIFYFERHCDGNVQIEACRGIGPNVCCLTSGAEAVSISKGPTDVAGGWNGGGCTNAVCIAAGAGTLCCVATGDNTPLYTGGSFFTIRGTKRAGPETCTSSMDINFFGFHTGNGTWGIQKAEGEQTDSWAELRETFKGVPKKEKVSWLQAHSAVFIEDNAGPVQTKVSSAVLQ